VSSEDRTRARAPSASYCSIEGVAPLHTAPPVPVKASVWILLFYEILEKSEKFYNKINFPPNFFLSKLNKNEISQPNRLFNKIISFPLLSLGLSKCEMAQAKGN
jgi:hypothetical protein